MYNHSLLLDLDGISGIIAVSIPIIITLAAFLLTFALYYLRFKDRQSMIEKGLDPGPFMKKGSMDQGSRSWPITLSITSIGIGIGLIIGYIITHSGGFKGDDAPINFSFVVIFGGLGLFLSEIIQRKMNQNSDKSPKIQQ